MSWLKTDSSKITDIQQRSELGNNNRNKHNRQIFSNKKINDNVCLPPSVAYSNSNRFPDYDYGTTLMTPASLSYDYSNDHVHNGYCRSDIANCDELTFCPYQQSSSDSLMLPTMLRSLNINTAFNNDNNQQTTPIQQVNVADETLFQQPPPPLMSQSFLFPGLDLDNVNINLYDTIMECGKCSDSFSLIPPPPLFRNNSTAECLPELVMITPSKFVTDATINCANVEQYPSIKTPASALSPIRYFLIYPACLISVVFDFFCFNFAFCFNLNYLIFNNRKYAFKNVVFNF